MPALLILRMKMFVEVNLVSQTIAPGQQSGCGRLDDAIPRLAHFAPRTQNQRVAVAMRLKVKALSHARSSRVGPAILVIHTVIIRTLFVIDL